jgi:hypothetical protein
MLLFFGPSFSAHIRMCSTAPYNHQLLIETLVRTSDCTNAVTTHTHICDVLICTTRGTIHNNTFVTEHPRVNICAQTAVLLNVFC